MGFLLFIIRKKLDGLVESIVAVCTGGLHENVGPSSLPANIDDENDEENDDDSSNGTEDTTPEGLAFLFVAFLFVGVTITIFFGC